LRGVKKWHEIKEGRGNGRQVFIYCEWEVLSGRKNSRKAGGPMGARADCLSRKPLDSGVHLPSEHLPSFFICTLINAPSSQIGIMSSSVGKRVSKRSNTTRDKTNIDISFNRAPVRARRIMTPSVYALPSEFQSSSRPQAGLKKLPPEYTAAAEVVQENWSQAARE